jgi:phage tail-like protein
MPDEAPFRNFNFTVETVHFAEVDVPDASIEVVEYREGGALGSSTIKLPSRVSYSNLVLRRGVATDLTLYEWFDAVRNGNLFRRNVVITLLDAERTPVRVWKLYRAWPVKYTGPKLCGKGNEVVIEELVITHEGLEVEAVG